MAEVSESSEDLDPVLASAVARERRLWDAFQANDVIALESLIAEEATDVGPAGVLSRAGTLDAVARMRIVAYSLESPLLQAHGGVEILTYRSTVDGTYNGLPFPARAVLNASVWVGSDTRWRLIHRQETPVRD